MIKLFTYDIILPPSIGMAAIGMTAISINPSKSALRRYKIKKVFPQYLL